MVSGRSGAWSFRNMLKIHPAFKGHRLTDEPFGCLPSRSLRVRRTLRISCEAVPAASARAGMSRRARLPGAGESFVSCIRLFGCLIALPISLR
jgi:hypothetical protein